MGEDGFWYVIEDVQGRRNSARVSVDVKPISSPLPAPQADFANVPQGTSVRIDVLKNDLFSTGDYGFNLSIWDKIFHTYRDQFNETGEIGQFFYKKAK